MTGKLSGVMNEYNNFWITENIPLWRQNSLKTRHYYCFKDTLFTSTFMQFK